MISLALKSLLAKKQAILFVGVNILVAFLSFVRSFAFMKFFDFKELGSITLVTTATMLVGFFQIGLINGGFRIIALGQDKSSRKTNNVIFSYFGILSVALLFFFIIGFFLGFLTDYIVVLFIYFMGIAMLVTNWLTNTLIGGGEYRRLNIANVLSAVTGSLCLLLAYYYGFYGALISILIQPLFFIVIVFGTDIKEIPTKFDLDINHIKYILSFGFIPFLAGIFFLVYMQLERWGINLFLGPEALGKMYLIFLIVTLWVLVPSSILNLFFPKAVKYYSDNDLVNFDKTFSLSAKITLGYCLVMSSLIVISLNPFVSFMFPKHLPYVYLVMLGLPGMVARTLCDPISLYLNSIVRLKPLFWSEIFALIAYVLCVAVLVLFNLVSLKNFVICFNIYFLFKFLYLFIGYYKSRIKFHKV
jgi:O-antigen/teichoic acid export membrane protein